MTDVHTEKKLSGSLMFDGKIINVEHDRVLLENGKEALREVVRHPGAVGVFVMDGDKTVLVRQYRYAIGRELWEIPAGKLEKGEEPLPAAERELREETGCTGKLVHLGTYFGSAGICDEKLELYFARAEAQVGQDLDEDEFLSVARVTLPELERMIAAQEIPDGKTLCAYTLAKAKGLI